MTTTTRVLRNGIAGGPGDDLVLELAVAANCNAVITHNVRDFVGADRFGVRVMSPGEFLNELRSSK
ncbi:MAG TPA: hypothetical protein VNA69_23840 [Thermoanaerobaculia bacterium]|nr:hypothetical protein [Thermoanaerobaculia bacterium]